MTRSFGSTALLFGGQLSETSVEVPAMMLGVPDETTTGKSIRDPKRCRCYGPSLRHYNPTESESQFDCLPLYVRSQISHGSDVSTRVAGPSLTTCDWTQERTLIVSVYPPVTKLPPTAAFVMSVKAPPLMLGDDTSRTVPSKVSSRLKLCLNVTWAPVE